MSGDPTHHPEADKFLGVRLQELDPCCTAAEGGRLVPRSATRDAGMAVFVLIGRIVSGRGTVVIQPVVCAPLPEIAVHVVQAKGIGREGPACRGDMRIRPAWLFAECVLAVETRHRKGERLAETERRCSPCPAGIFPFRFTGQAIDSGCLLRKTLAERLRILP